MYVFMLACNTYVGLPVQQERNQCFVKRSLLESMKDLMNECDERLSYSSNLPGI